MRLAFWGLGLLNDPHTCKYLNSAVLWVHPKPQAATLKGWNHALLLCLGSSEGPQVNRFHMDKVYKVPSVKGSY